MDKNVCLTIDLESDYAGFGKYYYHCWEENKIKSLLKVLKKYNAPLTIFVVANTLKKHKKIISLFQKAGCEFHLHSYSHDIKNSDSLDQIMRGQKEFRNQLGYNPSGYRAPMGYITPEGLANLKKLGFEFDSSVFPSFWPKISFFTKPNYSYIDKDSGILELPISTISPMRFLITLSWLKLLGWKFYKFVLENFKMRNIVVFGFHLHDVWESPAKEMLPVSWKIRYLNNSGMGLTYLEKFIKFAKKNNYNFCYLSDVAKKEKLASRKKELFYNTDHTSLKTWITKIETSKRVKYIFNELLKKSEIRGKTFLEVGIGFGDVSQRATDLGAKITGVDIGAKFVALAKRKMKKGHFLLASTEILPFKDNSFDIVVCSQVLRHVARPHEAISEMLRVVKPGGTIIITAPNKLFMPLGMLMSKIQKYKGYENWFYPAEIGRLFTKNGGKVVAQRYFHPFSDNFILKFLEGSKYFMSILPDFALKIKKIHKSDE